MGAAVDVEQVAEGVHRFGDGIVNCYALVDGDEVVLVDAAFPRSFEELTAALERIGRSPADVTTVLMTHGHIDHVGGAERLRRRHGATVRAHPHEFDRLEGRRTSGRPAGLTLGVLPNLWRSHTWRFLAHSLRHGFLRPEWVRELEPAWDGERLDLPGRPQVVSTPGHTQGHLAFHLRDAGMTITGDALTTMNVLTGGTGPQLEALTEEPHEAWRSLDRFLDLDTTTLLPGHGDPWMGSVAEAVQQARDTASLPST
jgi:glyoxylase-like metal-dependent hydrolase (beta-lactamase superfamily II)